jgi:hypothetical protein
MSKNICHWQSATVSSYRWAIESRIQFNAVSAVQNMICEARSSSYNYLTVSEHDTIC